MHLCGSAQVYLKQHYMARLNIELCHKGWSHFDPESFLLTGSSAMQPVTQPSAPTMAEIPLCLFG